MKIALLAALGTCVSQLAFAAGAASPSEPWRSLVTSRVESEYPSLFVIYTNLHAHPELSFMEIKTGALVAGELRGLGFTVTEKVGKTGVVGVLSNGAGPTVLVRADMDALPIKENSGVPYASTDIGKDMAGKDQPVMHGCAHDTHVTGLIGTARVLVALKEKWAGTLVLVAQPAEEIVAGARAMLADGLYTRFPKPDFAIALHTTSSLAAGVVGYGEGPFLASVNSMDIQVRGVGGHGSAPQTTKDPVVLASQIVLALQTIVSREIKPGAPAVVTVGTIHGGLKRNIIPDEVKLELTLRAFDEKVMAHLIASIRRICAGLARAAGLPDDRLPVISAHLRIGGGDEQRSGAGAPTDQDVRRMVWQRPGKVAGAHYGRGGLLRVQPGKGPDQHVVGRCDRSGENRRKRAHGRGGSFEPFRDLRSHPGAHVEDVRDVHDGSRAGAYGAPVTRELNTRWGVS